MAEHHHPFLDRIRDRGKVGHGKAYEKKAVLSMGARLHPNSGSKAGAKSDASLHQFRMEMKTTISTILPIRLDWLMKIASEARRQNQIPALVFSFVMPDGTPVQSIAENEWVAVPKSVFLGLVNGEQ